MAFTVAKPPVMDGLTTRVHCDVLKLLGTWRTGGKWPTSARIITAGHTASGCGEPSSDWVRAYLGAQIFYSLGYPLCAEHESRYRRGSRRSSLAARYTASEDLFMHCTMAIFVSRSDRAHLGVIYFKICTALGQA
jgi:hypothetical protein